MKRIVSLILAAAFVLGSFGAGMAADFKTTGEFAFGFQWADNELFDDETASDFAAVQRVRIQTVIAASENVSGTLFFEIGDINWGVAGDNEGGALGTDGVNIETRRAYIDFTVPSTDLAIRMGLQGVALPSAVANSPVLDDDAAAIVASYAFNDMFSATALWARPFANATGILDMNGVDVDSVDLFGGIVGVKGDGFSVQPYFLFANINERKTYDAAGKLTSATGIEGEAYWAGVAAELNMFDPLTFGADVVYSNVDVDFNGADRDARDGWFLAADAAYKLDFLTAVFTTWYSTGEDKNGAAGDEGFTKLSAGDFAPTSFGTDGGAFVLTDNVIGSNGNWGIALAAEDITFVEGLSHAVRVAYYNGTNDADAELDGNKGVALGDDDSAWELNFDTHYAIYENLAADVQLGWAKLDLDAADQDEEDAWRLGLGLTYNF